MRPLSLLLNDLHLVVEDTTKEITMINCQHWSNCGVTGGGCCAKNLFGSRPSLGTCRHACKEREPIPDYKEPINPPSQTNHPENRIIHGITGIAKAITGTGGASEQVVAERQAICESCPKAIIAAGVLRRCSLCGCSTWAKIRNANEQCPDNPPRWLKVSAKD